MNQAPCPYDDEKAQEMLLPRTTLDPLTPEVEAHLEGCAVCRGRLAGLQNEVRGLREMFRGGSLSVSRAPTESDERPGSFGPYRILGSFSSGGQGTAYRAVHSVLGQEVVLKMASRAMSKGSPPHQQLVAQVKRLAQISHPALARVYDLEMFQDRPCLVREYISGHSLEDHVAGKRPSSTQAASLAAAVARAAAAAHRQGIVHQGVHPGNIVIDKHGKAHLLDLGAAYLRTAGSAEASGTVDPRVDVRGLGAVLFFLLVGKCPPNTGEERQFELRSANVPRRLEAICLKCLAGDYASADPLAGDLESFAHASVKRLLFTRWLPAAVVLGALAAAAWWLWQALSRR